MSGFRGSMADDLMSSGAKLDDVTACSQALLAAGWRATHVAAWVDDAVRLARAMSEACDRDAIIRDMASDDACDGGFELVLTAPHSLPGSAPNNGSEGSFL